MPSVPPARSRYLVLALGLLLGACASEDREHSSRQRWSTEQEWHDSVRRWDPRTDDRTANEWREAAARNMPREGEYDEFVEARGRDERQERGEREEREEHRDGPRAGGDGDREAEHHAREHQTFDRVHRDIYQRLDRIEERLNDLERRLGGSGDQRRRDGTR